MSATLRTAETAPAAGWWTPDGVPPAAGDAALREGLLRFREPLVLLEDGQTGRGGRLELGPRGPEGARRARAFVPPSPPEALGEPSFLRTHGVRWPYATGSMANGIASVELVEASARAGLLGFFGAAGLSPEAVEAAVARLRSSLGDAPHGFNLIHSPAEPALEEAVAELYLRRGVRLVEASAYLDLTLPLVLYRTAGVRRGPDGAVVAPNRVVAKVSREELAEKFFSPPPERLLAELVSRGRLTREQAALAAELPVAEDLTAEADSGGHTDNRPLVAMLPTFLSLRDRLQGRYAPGVRLRVGAAGGISTPESAAAAFAMGAAYVLTGSVNQACSESGSSDKVRALLAQARQADVAMAPAADMFELGVKLQVLRRGTMFAMRAAKLHELYVRHPSLEALPPAERAALEKTLFRAPLEEIWARTRDFFARRDPAQAEQAERDPKHKMALVFRWYLGLSSRWANAGEAGRELDYQVWCGPAMGAFNEWARGSALEAPAARRVGSVAHNILAGAAFLSRAGALARQGVSVPPAVRRFPPLPPERALALLEGNPG